MIVRLYSSILETKSETLRNVLKSDVCLGSVDKARWSAKVHEAFGGLCGVYMYRQHE